MVSSFLNGNKKKLSSKFHYLWLQNDCMKHICFLCCVTFAYGLFGQKKTIDHTAYASWKRNENQLVSNDGNYIIYEINPLKGDGYLYLYAVETGKTDSFPRGKSATFSFNSDYCVFKITPGFDTLRTCELKKINKKKWPTDSLAVYLFATNTLIKYPDVSSFTVGKDHNWTGFLSTKNELKPVDGEKKKRRKRKNKQPEYTSEGNRLTILEPRLEKEYTFIDVSRYTFSPKGSFVAFTEHRKEKTDSFTLQVLNLKTEELFPSAVSYCAVEGLAFDYEEKRLAFLSSTDTSEVKNFSLYMTNLARGERRTIIDTASYGLPTSTAVSTHRAPFFSEDGRFLFFGVAERPKKKEKDTLTENEKVTLDIWHYNDKRIQPQQLVELKNDAKKTDLYVYHLANEAILQLSKDTLFTAVTEKISGNYVLAESTERYAIQKQWESPESVDYYRVSLENGEAELIKEAVKFNGELSPSGNYFSYFDAIKKQHYLIDLATKTTQCMTCSATSVDWQEDINSQPMLAAPVGTKGYSRDEKEFFIQSKYDTWVYRLEDNTLHCITRQEGEKRKIRMELEKWEKDSVFVEAENCFFTGFNETTKGFHLFDLTEKDGEMILNERYVSNHKLISITRSANKKTILFRKSSVELFPDVRILSQEYDTEKVLSTTNPQQVEYNWATVELIDWKSYSKTPLQGLVYKPADFDPSKKYPLIIYYYELNSEGLHNHYPPKPTASVIHPTEYASAGYIVLVPDIRYTVGHPAQSAYDCIMSGTDRVLKLYPSIDSTKMGLQGQSWGGYQTAQLITMTTRYAAAMAGAPVSNMLSAYGGIRWGTGINRQFQYESTQSRIGKTIWEAPTLYLENSPLFHVPTIQTPLLIMANDKDGSVPWYQGIELYTAMRRLAKPCWMLNYNGDDHNLTRTANRIDLSIRMRQFFDHYLLGKSAPAWLVEGLPATKKGKELRY
jgi:dipeptidyl aminopeptidase/acylaminoacyl peptidase